jgi:hypothetical protein
MTQRTLTFSWRRGGQLSEASTGDIDLLADVALNPA